MKTEKNFYETLGVHFSATVAEIKKAYRNLAQKWHPDKNNGSKLAEEMFKKIKAAYEVLVDAVKRKEYDLKLETERVDNEKFRQRAPQQYSSNNSNWVGDLFKVAAMFAVLFLVFTAVASLISSSKA